MAWKVESMKDLEYDSRASAMSIINTKQTEFEDAIKTRLTAEIPQIYGWSGWPTTDCFSTENVIVIDDSPPSWAVRARSV